MNDVSNSYLILAAEDCGPETFDELHKFSTRNDRRVLAALEAHGPVLLRGGRGTGKSAFMISAARRLDPITPEASAIGIYMSLRNAPLLKSTGRTYERILCEIIITTIRKNLEERASSFDPPAEVRAVQTALTSLARNLQKRLVLFFDDAAHLGRETSLEEFFDVFRTLSSSSVSCKAAIYPGVTHFGTRFDVYNDATVVELQRSEEMSGFAQIFEEIMSARFPGLFGEEVFSSTLNKRAVAAFLAQATLGNMRGFVIACSVLRDVGGDSTVDLNTLTRTLITLAANHFWPLLDELAPKLGKYVPIAGTSKSIAELLFRDCGQQTGNPRDVLIHRDVDERLAKPLQILEYAGFISKREASRGMKQGGRGARYALNLCNLLEQTPNSRLTRDLFNRWSGGEKREEAVQYNRASKLENINLPELEDCTELAIFGSEISSLRKSNAYPYGLTELKIKVLSEAGIQTVSDLAETSDEDLATLRSIDSGWIRRIHNILGQAIWM